jgi:hypothetical protein
MLSMPLPPDAGTSGVSFVTAISHLLPDGPATLVLADRQAAANTTATNPATTGIFVRVETHMASIFVREKNRHLHANRAT